ncbi:hypothetical protein HP1_22 [Citrobacter phage vB_CbrM_HP1]|uniref:Uncharacterized protein n=1 Tax=Citrobacter phage vB_CbrM_HP1 TaxID=2876111 RepID=A0AAE9CHE1_9CAUD|nr:hypothetical protein HP1_22 [Citrobacter phage vB_CbrM_HP1]
MKNLKTWSGSNNFTEDRLQQFKFHFQGMREGSIPSPFAKQKG